MSKCPPELKSLQLMQYDDLFQPFVCFIDPFIIKISTHKSAAILILQVRILKYDEIKKCDQVLTKVRIT